MSKNMINCLNTDNFNELNKIIKNIPNTLEKDVDNFLSTAVYLDKVIVFKYMHNNHIDYDKIYYNKLSIKYKSHNCINYFMNINNT